MNVLMCGETIPGCVRAVEKSRNGPGKYAGVQYGRRSRWYFTISEFEWRRYRYNQRRKSEVWFVFLTVYAWQNGNIITNSKHLLKPKWSKLKPLVKLSSAWNKIILLQRRRFQPRRMTGRVPTSSHSSCLEGRALALWSPLGVVWTSPTGWSFR